MEFAGGKFLYLSKLKKDKIKKIKSDYIFQELNKSNHQNQNKKSEVSIDSDDDYLAVNSDNFNIDLVNENIIIPINSILNIQFKYTIDTNVCVIHLDVLENESEQNIFKLYQCEKCKAYLNKYSVLNPTSQCDIYEWECEFCFNINKNLHIEKENIPKNESIEKSIESLIEKDINKEEDSSLIFCFDISGSMCQSYKIKNELKEKFMKIIKNIENKNNIDFTNYDFSQNNTDYISRLDMVKLSIENNINTLLKKSPNEKVGIVSFGSEIEVKGDCLSNLIRIREKDMNNESKIKSFGNENTNLIKNPIKDSSLEIIKSLRATEEYGSTALGPAILLSLSLLNNAKIGSKIILCTDGMSNLGVGNISEDRERAKEFYNNIGNMAKEKGIVISLITFEDSESEISVLKNMIEYSGGEIIRVNPNNILDGFNDFLDLEIIASEVEIKINLNKSMTFRDEDEKEMINEGSSIVRKIGNISKKSEDYYEFKFKESKKLVEMNEINFDKLKNLFFQSEIIYKKTSGEKYIRIITKSLEISDNKEEINYQANLNIVSTLQTRKIGKLAEKGNLLKAQAIIHATRNYLKKHKNLFEQFNIKMNNFNMNLSSLNNQNFKNLINNNQNFNRKNLEIKAEKNKIKDNKDMNVINKKIKDNNKNNNLNNLMNTNNNNQNLLYDNNIYKKKNINFNNINNNLNFNNPNNVKQNFNDNLNNLNNTFKNINNINNSFNIPNYNPSNIFNNMNNYFNNNMNNKMDTININNNFHNENNIRSCEINSLLKNEMIKNDFFVTQSYIFKNQCSI